MSLISALAIYFIIWWVVLFAVLPIGVRSQSEEGDIVLGTEHGAPIRPMLVRKAVLTTIIAAIIFTAVLRRVRRLWDSRLKDLIV